MEINRDNKLIELLIKDGWLKTDRIIKAFKEINREDFLPEDSKSLSQINEALPIGFSQTISQPLTVAFMLELLAPDKGDKILDIGAGSGWTSALLGSIVRQGKGKVIALEIVPELAEFGKNNVSKYSYISKNIVEFLCEDGSKGFQKYSLYDKILASAAGSVLPQEWKDQLKIGGRIVCPINSSIWLFIKKSNNEFESKEYPGFVFVPLTKNEDNI